MHGRLRARLAAQEHVGARGNHFVDVHVGLRAGAGLPHRQREVIVELAVDHLLRGTHDRGRAPSVERSELKVRLRRCTLDERQRVDDRQRHPLVADAEVAEGAFGLRAPQPVGRHLDWPESVSLDARDRHELSRGQTTEDRRLTDDAYSVLCPPSCVVYFLRNRSRRTTSPPPSGLCGPSSDGASAAGVAFCGTAAIAGVVRVCFGSAAGRVSGGVAGAAGAVASAAAGSATGSNFTPNGTDGSTNSLIEANVTASRSGMPPNDMPTSKPVSLTIRSQN